MFRRTDGRTPAGSVDGVYEQTETCAVRRILRPGQVFIDVGAHVGYYTVLAARIVGPGGIVHAFEPDPENAAVLRRNVGAFPGIAVVHECAVSDRSGRALLYRSTENSGDHRLYETPGRAAVDVMVMTLDSVFLRSRPVDFIKIDVQGEECRVLRGARALLEGSPRITGMIEFSPEHLRLAGSRPEELLEMLVGLGFRIAMPVRGMLIPASIDRLPGIKRHVNLFFRRKGRRAE